MTGDRNPYSPDMADRRLTPAIGSPSSPRLLASSPSSLGQRLQENQDTDVDSSYRKVGVDSCGAALVGDLNAVKQELADMKAKYTAEAEFACSEESACRNAIFRQKQYDEMIEDNTVLKGNLEGLMQQLRSARTELKESSDFMRQSGDARRVQLSEYEEVVKRNGALSAQVAKLQTGVDDAQAELRSQKGSKRWQQPSRRPSKDYAEAVGDNVALISECRALHQEVMTAKNDLKVEAEIAREGLSTRQAGAHEVRELAGEVERLKQELQDSSIYYKAQSDCIRTEVASRHDSDIRTLHATEYNDATSMNAALKDQIDCLRQELTDERIQVKVELDCARTEEAIRFDSDLRDLRQQVQASEAFQIRDAERRIQNSFAAELKEQSRDHRTKCEQEEQSVLDAWQQRNQQVIWSIEAKLRASSDAHYAAEQREAGEKVELETTKFEALEREKMLEHTFKREAHERTLRYEAEEHRALETQRTHFQLQLDTLEVELRNAADNKVSLERRGIQEYGWYEAEVQQMAERQKIGELAFKRESKEQCLAVADEEQKAMEAQRLQNQEEMEVYSTRVRSISNQLYQAEQKEAHELAEMDAAKFEMTEKIKMMQHSFRREMHERSVDLEEQQQVAMDTCRKRHHDEALQFEDKLQSAADLHIKSEKTHARCRAEFESQLLEMRERDKVLEHTYRREIEEKGLLVGDEMQRSAELERVKTQDKFNELESRIHAANDLRLELERKAAHDRAQSETERQELAERDKIQRHQFQREMQEKSWSFEEKLQHADWESKMAVLAVEQSHMKLSLDTENRVELKMKESTEAKLAAEMSEARTMAQVNMRMEALEHNLVTKFRMEYGDRLQREEREEANAQRHADESSERVVRLESELNRLRCRSGHDIESLQSQLGQALEATQITNRELRNLQEEAVQQTKTIWHLELMEEALQRDCEYANMYSEEAVEQQRRTAAEKEHIQQSMKRSFELRMKKTEDSLRSHYKGRSDSVEAKCRVEQREAERQADLLERQRIGEKHVTWAHPYTVPSRPPPPPRLEAATPRTQDYGGLRSLTSTSSITSTSPDAGIVPPPSGLLFSNYPPTGASFFGGAGPMLPGGMPPRRQRPASAGTRRTPRDFVGGPPHYEC